LAAFVDLRNRHVRTNQPSLSIVVEWENARLSEADRSLRMLTELSRQLEDEKAGSSRHVDVLVLHNPEAVDAEAVGAMIDSARPRAEWPAEIRIAPAGEGGYYDQKNFGVAATTGDLVLFLDSDVVPEAGWLRRLLHAFDDPGVEVVCGSTYVELTNFYDRAMALFWLFPLRTEREQLEEAKAFYANNVAFRRSVIAANPFPELTTFRGQCQLLSKRLRENGHHIFRHTGARVSHPPPNGLRHFVNRAMAQGHDMALREAVGDPSFARRALDGLTDFRKRMARSTRRIRRGYHAVGLSRAGAVGAWGVALAYNGCLLTGRLLTAVQPRIVERYFPIS
jgi:hypothetical protein